VTEPVGRKQALVVDSVIVRQLLSLCLLKHVACEIAEAKDGLEPLERLEALSLGADAYVTKPVRTGPSRGAAPDLLPVGEGGGQREV